MVYVDDKVRVCCFIVTGQERLFTPPQLRRVLNSCIKYG